MSARGWIANGWASQPMFESVAPRAAWAVGFATVRHDREEEARASKKWRRNSEWNGQITPEILSFSNSGARSSSSSE